MMLKWYSDHTLAPTDLCLFPVVTCSAPTGINNGYMTNTDKKEYGFKETVKYGCNVDYVLDGPVEIECLKTGDWSKEPVCKGRTTDFVAILYFV
jgi:hypothetical protein